MADSLTADTTTAVSRSLPTDLQSGEQLVFLGERPAVRHPKVSTKKPRIRITGTPSIRRRFVTTRCEAALVTNWRLILIPAKKAPAGVPSSFILNHEALRGIQEKRRLYAEKATQARDAAIGGGKHLGGLVTGWKAIRAANRIDAEAQAQLGHGPAVVVGIGTRRHAVPSTLNIDGVVYWTGVMIMAPLFIPGLNFFYVFFFVPLFVCWEVFGRLLAMLDRSLPLLGFTAWQSTLVTYSPADVVAGGQVYESLRDRTGRGLMPRTHARNQAIAVHGDSIELRLESRARTVALEQALRKVVET